MRIIPSQNPELPPEAIRRLREIFGDGALLTDPADCWAYGYDNSRRQALPQAVAFATGPKQVQAVAIQPFGPSGIASCDTSHDALADAVADAVAEGGVIGPSLWASLRFLTYRA